MRPWPGGGTSGATNKSGFDIDQIFALCLLGLVDGFLIGLDDIGSGLGGLVGGKLGLRLSQR